MSSSRSQDTMSTYKYQFIYARNTLLKYKITFENLEI